MSDQPLILLLSLLAAAVILWLWIKDYRANQSGQPHPGALPGAWPASTKACLIAVAGAMVLLLMEVLGEYQWGFVEKQTEITILFGIVTLGAAILEEVIFRGYLVVTQRGRAWLIGSVVFFSLIFTLIHPFFWDWTVVVEADESLGIEEEKGLVWDFSAKAWYTSSFLFLNSLWFYAVRFMPANPKWSLLPCFLAHASSNLGVFLIKGGQGYVSGLW